MKPNSENSGPIRVLMVEDNPADAQLVSEYLQDAAPGKFQLVHVVRLADALKEMRGHVPDAVLLDPNLPDASGTEGYTQLARIAPGVPVIVLTGADDASLEKRLLALGARDYLRKSHFNGGNLAAALTNWVSLARASR